MVTFENLPYFGSKLACKHCNAEAYFSNQTHIRIDNINKYQYGYQCQDCGAFKMSEFDIPYADFLEKRCECGGQFRRDKTLFCSTCKHNKTEENVSLAHTKILHLDDHLLFANGISGFIRKEFKNVIIKNIQNGNEALEYVMECFRLNQQLDLIITDINHPGLNGIDFAKEVRMKEIKFSNLIPIIFFTMVEDINYKKRAEEMNLVKYFFKSASPEELNSAIGLYIKKS